MAFHSVTKPDWLMKKPATRLFELQAQVDQEARLRLKQTKSIWAAAPGRVNLIGEHVDYNDGFVLPMAIERYTIVAAALTTDSTRSFANCFSIDLQENIEVPLQGVGTPTLHGWGLYLEGVIAGFVDRGIEIPPFDAVIGSNIPTGAGLSSSAALEVSMATLLESLTGRTLDPVDKAVLCQTAEHRFAGVPCGIMDQFSSVFGKPNELMLLDCQSQEIKPVPFVDDRVSLLIINSNVKHKLADGAYAQRRAQCESALHKLNLPSWRNVTLDIIQAHHESLSQEELPRALHVVSETQRTLSAATAIKAASWEELGQLMYASHASLRDQYEVSCLELDLLVRLANSIGIEGGVYGSRMTGGGFGGCTVSLIRTESLNSVIEFIHDRYFKETGIQAESFTSRPAQGAHVIARA